MPQEEWAAWELRTLPPLRTATRAGAHPEERVVAPAADVNLTRFSLWESLRPKMCTDE